MTKYPVLPGHEWAGEVVETGSDVPTGLFPKGAKVTADVTMSCGKCFMCKLGRYNLCINRGVIGSYKNRAGAYAEYIVVPWKHAYVLPEGVTTDIGALSEPSATALYSLKRARMQPGSTVVSFGDGPIGLLVTAFARALGAGRIIQVGSWKEKLEVSSKLGADNTINYHDDDVVQSILDLTDGRGAELIIESSGNTLAFEQAVDALAPGGGLGLLSFYRSTSFEASINKITTKDADMFGVLASPNTTAPSLKMIAAGTVQPGHIITHHFPLEEARKAFDLMLERKEFRIKMMLHP
jgi:2-desacetyl-2-hydroxyethyl bacteriochlorophyllide A dehydrogenase